MADGSPDSSPAPATGSDPAAPAPDDAPPAAPPAAPADADIRKGCRVRLHGLSTALLNGSEGCVVGAADPDSGRHPVKLLRPPEAVAAFPQGIKVKPGNLERVQLPQPAAPPGRGSAANQAKRESRKAAATGGGGGGVDSPLGPAPGPALDPAAWAQGLQPAEAAEWFVDCYRMRVDDDYCWGGGNLHGLYDMEGGRDAIVPDFLVFCKLAVVHRVLPSRWSWELVFEKGAELLGYAFEKSDAKEKYGGENYFQAAMGGRSLRATGEFVYGSSCMGGGEGKAHAAMQRLVGAAPLARQLSKPQLFADVGGAGGWRRLQGALGNAPGATRL